MIMYFQHHTVQYSVLEKGKRKKERKKKMRTKASFKAFYNTSTIEKKV